MTRFNSMLQSAGLWAAGVVLLALYALLVGGLGWGLGAILGRLACGPAGVSLGGLVGLALFTASMAAASAGRPTSWAMMFRLGTTLCGSVTLASLCWLLFFSGGRHLGWAWMLGCLLGLPVSLLGAMFQYPDRSRLGLALIGTFGGLLTGAVGALLRGPTGWAIAVALGMLVLQGLLAYTSTPADTDSPGLLASLWPFWSWGLAGGLAGAAAGWLGHEVTVQAEQLQPPPLHVVSNLTLEVGDPRLQLLLNAGGSPVLLLALWLVVVTVTRLRGPQLPAQVEQAQEPTGRSKEGRSTPGEEDRPPQP